FNGTPSELKEFIRFQEERDFRLEWIDNSTFKFVSTLSLGTLIVNYTRVEGIKGFAKLMEMREGSTNVQLNTIIRIELYFFSLISIIMISVGLFSNESWPKWTFALFPIGLLWLWWVYRMQEKTLFAKLKKYINTDIN